MKRIVIFSDSLALPRISPQKTMFEETYPFYLRKNFEIFQFSKGGGLIHDLVEQANYYSLYNPDIVILHCGIVDCACRAFSHNEELFFASNVFGRILRKLISVTITTKRLRNLRKKSWTPLDEFSLNCKRFKDIFHNVPIYALSILPVSDEYEKKVPGIRMKVAQYNLLLKQLFEDYFIDLSSIPSDGIMKDGHHLTHKGQLYVYNKIMEKIR